MIAEHLPPLLALLLGLALHVLTKHQEHCREGKAPGLVAFIRERRYRMAISVVGAGVGYLVLYDTGQLTLVAAVGVGYVCDSVPDALGRRARRQVEGG